MAFSCATSVARLSSVGGGAAARPCCAATVGTIAPGYPARSAAIPKRTPHATSDRLRIEILVVIPSPPILKKRAKCPSELAECSDSGGHHQFVTDLQQLDTSPSRRTYKNRMQETR